MKNVAQTKDKIAIILIKMLRDGPEVSFSGSPTVSPTTDAAWAASPLGFPFLIGISPFPGTLILKLPPIVIFVNE